MNKPKSKKPVFKRSYQKKKKSPKKKTKLTDLMKFNKEPPKSFLSKKFSNKRKKRDLKRTGKKKNKYNLKQAII